MKKPRLTVLVGAGASVDLGVPDSLAAMEILLREDPLEHERDYIRTTKEAVRIVHRLLATRWKRPNFEHLLHALEAMTTLQRSWRPTTSEQHSTVHALLAGGPRSELLPLFQNDGLAATTAAWLLRQLHEMFSGHPKQPSGPAWDNYRSFWRRLAEIYHLDVGAINYDEIIGVAAPFLHQGFIPVDGEDVGRFDPRAFRAATDRLAHMHGSVRFGYRTAAPNRFIYEDYWEDVYLHASSTAAGRSWGGRSHPSSQAGDETIVGPIITGLQKPNKLIAAEPYASYHRAFADWLQENSRLLVVGYSFGDHHLNHLLGQMTRWHGDSRRIAMITMMSEEKWIENLNGHERLPESKVISRWSEESGIWHSRNIFAYENPWRSRNGLCALFLDGLLGTAEHRMDELLKVLA